MITRVLKHPHLNTSSGDLSVIIEHNLDKSRSELYYHCCSCGIVYDDHAYTKPVIDVLIHTGKYSLPKEFTGYRITTGICTPCNTILENKLLMEMNE